mgnify:CR=1 FL=1
MTQKQSVVIIGGGPAGLTAAWELVKDGGSENYDVTVLEATREFGGISRTVKHWRPSFLLEGRTHHGLVEGGPAAAGRAKL